ncbi:hypothetical protein [Buttiauxella gaviniae]|uniref:hypothetical protein n=1 Tax=Buttiauxella gaviniae TaxID=82990 RepID=UPI000A03B320|nr:hypothetical protein [Buttiauxella gaviniae]
MTTKNAHHHTVRFNPARTEGLEKLAVDIGYRQSRPVTVHALADCLLDRQFEVRILENRVKMNATKNRREA